MRIIDKNTDFYDFYQNVYYDNTFTFDRRDSYLLTKNIFCSKLILGRKRRWMYSLNKYENCYFHVVLQICNTFWLFLIIPTEFNEYECVTDYKIELLKTWKNFNRPRKLCSLDVIDASWYNSKWHSSDIMYKDTKYQIDKINRGEIKPISSMTNYITYNGGKKIEKHIPLLKACGISNLIDAHEVYLAFEEYFALEKSDSERREPLGTTDIDKVESHGFDKVTSFRGKI